MGNDEPERISAASVTLLVLLTLLIFQYQTTYFAVVQSLGILAVLKISFEKCIKERQRPVMQNQLLPHHNMVKQTICY